MRRRVNAYLAERHKETTGTGAVGRCIRVTRSPTIERSIGRPRSSVTIVTPTDGRSDGRCELDRPGRAEVLAIVIDGSGGHSQGAEGLAQRSAPPAAKLHPRVVAGRVPLAAGARGLPQARVRWYANTVTVHGLMRVAVTVVVCDGERCGCIG
jgi:hypothetical protein